MCGLSGIVRFENKVEKREIENMNKAIRHRGPDDEGVYIEGKYDGPFIGLGHVRLSILDVSHKGHQPMGLINSNKKVIYDESYLDRADIIIVYNGEIYNYLELKEKYNLKTETNTDTEIILRMYKKFGTDCVKYFNGMWAFCIYDKEKNILFMSRDRVGKKPFYYYWDGKEFIFSSELKGILAVKRLNNIENINKDALELYFSLGFVPSPYSIFNNVSKLEAHTNLILDLKERKIKKYAYWFPPNYDPIYDKNYLKNEIKSIIFDAVKIRLRSDVPIGAFLSGGLDSSCVVAIMKNFLRDKNFHTFSIGFKGKEYDETPYIKIVVNFLKTNHHHYYFKEEDFKKLINVYSWIYDEPFADYSGFPTYIVSKLARKYVKVSLSGDGGDEIFGGYLIHLNAYRIEILRKYLPKFLRNIIFKILPNINKLYLVKKAFHLSIVEPEEFFSSMKSELYSPSIYKIWTQNKLKNTLKISKNNLVEAIRLYDLLYYSLPDHFLVKVDRASMANSLEVRSPFLDYRLLELSQKIPIEWKVDIFKTKKLMREIIREFLPNKIVNRGKQGFTPPLKNWILKSEYISELKQNIDFLKDLNYNLYKFYKEKVFKNIDNNIFSNYIIRLFLFIKWWHKWINLTLN